VFIEEDKTITTADTTVSLPGGNGYDNRATSEHEQRHKLQVNLHYTIWGIYMNMHYHNVIHNLFAFDTFRTAFTLRILRIRHR